jgi:hypothetical protein
LDFEGYFLIIKKELSRSHQDDKHAGERTVCLSYDTKNQRDAIPAETVIKVD